MKLSADTLKVLNNFSAINPCLQIKAGSVQRTCSPQKTIVAEVDLEEEFPVDCAIYELGVLLNAMSFFGDDVEWEFNEHDVCFSDGDKNAFSYIYAAETSIISPYNFKFKFPMKFPPSPEISFSLSEEDLQKLNKVHKALDLKHLVVVGDGKKISLQAKTVGSDSTNVFSVDVGSKTKGNYNMIINFDNLTILPGSYEVDISSQGLCRLKNQNLDLTYWVAIEDSSTYEKD